MTSAEAKTHSFLQPLGQVPLHVRLAPPPGKNGVGTIAEADLDPDLLRYLQTCPSWNSVAEKRLKTGATMSKCVRGDEAALGLKTEIAGIVDEENPPKCRSLNRDTNLQLIPSERFAAFVRAIRKKWRPWLQQLGGKMREAVRADGMPETIYQKNGGDFLMMIQRHRANMLTIAIWRDALAGVSLAQSNTSIGWPLTSRGSEGEWTLGLE